tara:strand:+ start:147 stop:335 length:189 start_codon:yes stop_codon:yes gene_type:complete
MINKLFKKTQKISVIENGKVEYYFKITFLNNDTAVYNNSGNLIMRSTLKYNNNNKGGDHAKK